MSKLINRIDILELKFHGNVHLPSWKLTTLENSRHWLFSNVEAQNRGLPNDQSYQIDQLIRVDLSGVLSSMEGELQNDSVG